MTTVKITELTSIGANLATSTVVPVVNMAGTPTTQKTTVGNIANLILEGAGVDYPEASVALLAQTVSNAAQPNITSTGTLTGLTVSGNTNLGAVGNVRITGGTSGQVLSTDGAGNLSWANDAGGSYGNSNVATYLASYGSNTITTTGNVSVGNIIGNGQALTGIAGANVSGFVPNANVANTAFAVAAANVSGLGNIALSNYDGNASNVLHGDGSWSADTTTYGNSNVASYLPTYTGNIGVDTLVFSDNSFQATAFVGTATTAEGLSNVGNATVVVDPLGANLIWAFGSDGKLTTPDGTEMGTVEGANTFGFYNNNSNTTFLLEAGNVVWSFDGSANTLTLPNNGVIDNSDSNFEVRGIGNVNFEANSVVNIYTDVSGNAYQWQFGDDGNLVVPKNIVGTNSGEPIIIDAGTTLDSYISVPSFTDGGEQLAIVNKYAFSNGIRLETPGGNLLFGSDGNLTLPGNTFSVNYANGAQVQIGGGGDTGNVTFSNITIQGIGSPYGDDGLNLAPGPDSTANLQYFRVRGGDVPTHIHFDTGNNNAYDQYFGNDIKYLKLGLGLAGNVSIGTYQDGGVGPLEWIFDSNGNLVLASGNSVIQSIANSSLDPLNPNVSTMVLTPDSNYSSQALVLDPTAPGHIHLRAPSFIGNIDDPSANLFLGGETSSFEVGYGTNPNVFVHSNSYTWTFDNTGNLTLPASGKILVDDSQIISANNTNFTVRIQDQDDDGWNIVNEVDDGTGNLLSRTRLQRDNFQIGANLSGTQYYWQFQDTGTLDLAGNIKGPSTGVTSFYDIDYGNGAVEMKLLDNTDTLVSNVRVSNPNVTISTANSAYTWTFDNTGNLTLPSNTFSVNYANGTQVSLGGGAGSSISNGNSYANIVASDGNLVISLNSGSAEWIFGTDRKLYGAVDEDMFIVGIDDGSDIRLYNQILDTGLNPISQTRLDPDEFRISFNLDTVEDAWRIDSSDLRPPQGGSISQFDGNIRVYAMNAGGNPVASLQSVSNANDPNIFTTFDATTSGANITVYNGGSNGGTGNTWRFDNAGQLLFPGNSGVVYSPNGNDIRIFNNQNGGFTQLSWQDGAVLTPNANVASNVTLNSSGFVVSTTDDSFTTSNDWTFGTDGNLSAPGNITTTGNISANNFSGNTNGYTIGYLNIPQVAASNTTIGLTDAGKHYYSNTAGNLTLTIPNNATTSFTTGTAISIVVQAAGNILVNAAAGVTLYMAGNSTSANRVVGTYGMATLMKVASDTWFINGTGVS